ncbi:MAG: aminotransferase class V-fold PLP-dependent enzyme [Anaerolineae bacterium]|nr:aminotransferase class V-fold PLP-dependent enzyme [Anaerolineae bacterium]
MMIDLSPDEFRRLGYRAIDLLAEQMARIGDLPTRQPVPAEHRERLLRQPLPETPSDPDALLERFRQDILPYPMGNASPRFFAWVNSPPAPLAVIADLLAAGFDPSVAGGDHAAVYVEHAVLNWLKTIMGYPTEAGGVLVSGGSVANLVALAVMRHVRTAGSIRARGFQDQARPMVVYTSTQGHSCLQKAVELLGIGHDHLRKIPVDADYCMEVDALRQQITADRALGLEPVCVAASAGTVNTGAVDPLAELADLCEAEKLWFHVDGAYGGFGILSEQAGALYAGIERADSIAIDPHKWLYVPVECGCTLVRDAQAMRDSFSVMPPYLRDDAALPWFSEYTIQQTRGFKALKLWMVMQQIGITGYQELISRDIALARTLQQKIQARPEFELVAAGPLSITCFRLAPAGMSEADRNALNKAAVGIVQRSGEAFLTSTELDGKVVLRVCIVNFRTTEADLDRLLDAIQQAGEQGRSSRQD